MAACHAAHRGSQVHKRHCTQLLEFRMCCRVPDCTNPSGSLGNLSDDSTMDLLLRESTMVQSTSDNGSTQKDCTPPRRNIGTVRRRLGNN
eukprot:6489253-Amphidinium_carterae.3